MWHAMCKYVDCRYRLRLQPLFPGKIAHTTEDSDFDAGLLLGSKVAIK